MIKLFLIMFSLMFLIPSIDCFIDGNIIQAIELLLGSCVGIVLFIVISSKKRNIWYLVPTTLSIFGVVGIMVYYSNINIPNKVETTAEIVYLEKVSISSAETNKYYPTVKYEVDDKIYYKKITSQFGDFSIGEKVNFIYNSKNPNEANIKPNLLLLLASVSFVAFGVVFCLLWKRYNDKNEC